MSNLNATATLTVAVNTDQAFTEVNKLEQKLTKLGAHNLAGIGAGSQDSVNKLRMLEAEVEMLTKALDKQSQAKERLGRVTRSYSIAEGAARVSMRENADLAAQQVKALAIQADTELRTRKLGLQQILAATMEDTRVRKAGVTQYRAILENEAKDRKLGLQQLLAASMEETRVRKLGLQQVAAAKEDEDRTRKAGVTQYRAILENEAKDRKLGLQQLLAASMEEKRVRDTEMAERRLAMLQLAAMEEDRRRATQGKNLSVSYRAASPVQQAQQNLKAGIAIAAGADLSGYAAEALAAARAAGSVDALAAAKAKLVPQTQKLTDAHHALNAGVKELHTGVRGLAGSFGTLWMTYGSLVPLLAGAALGAAFKTTLDKGAEFEYQLTFVKALGGESAAAVQQLSNAALDLGKNGLYGPIKVAEGMRILAQAGLNAREQLAAIPQVLDLATVGELGVDAAAETLVGVATAFGRSKLALQDVGDVIAKAAAISQTSVQAMTESMKYASVVGEQYNVSLEDTSTALAVLAKLNITGTSAGTAFRNMVKELYTPTNEASKAFKLLGLETKNADGGMRNMVDIIYDLRSKLEPYDKASQTNILQKMFGERGAKEAVAMLAMTRNEWDKLKTSIEDSNGFMGQVAAELEATTKGTLAQAFNTLEATMIEVFNTSKYGMGDLASDLKNLFGSEEFKQTVADFSKAMLFAAQALIEYKDVVIAVLAGAVIGKLAVAVDTLAIAFKGVAIASVGAAGASGMGAITGVGARVLAALGPLAGPAGIVAALAAGLLLLWQSAKEGGGATDQFVNDVDRMNSVLDRQYKKLADANEALRERILLAKGLQKQDSSTTELLNAEDELARRKQAFQDKTEKKTTSGTLFERLTQGGALDPDRKEAREIASLEERVKVMREKQANAQIQSFANQVGQESAKAAEAEAEGKDKLKSGTKSLGDKPWAPEKSGSGASKFVRYDDKQALRQSGDLLARMKADLEGTRAPTQYESGIIALKEKLNSTDDDEMFKFKNGENRQTLMARIKEMEALSPVLNARNLSKDETAARVADIENGIQEEQAALAEREKMLQRSYAMGEVSVGQYYDSLTSLREESYKKAKADYDEEIELLTRLQKQYGEGSADFIDAGKKIKDTQSKSNRLDTTQSGKRADLQYERDSILSPWAGARQVMADVQKSAADLASTVRDGLKGSLDIATNAFVNMATTGKISVRGMVADMLNQLAKLAAHKAFMTIASMAMSAFSIGTAAGTSPSTVAAFGPTPTGGSLGTGLSFSSGSGLAIYPQKSGGAWLNGVQAFANGAAFSQNSVLNSPTFFRHAGGLGVAGEAGPEAIMPLTRGSNGQLGVKAHGSGGSGGSVTVNQQFNITVDGGNGDGKKQGDGIAKELGQQMKAMVMGVLIEQKRPGGVLAS